MKYKKEIPAWQYANLQLSKEVENMLLNGNPRERATIKLLKHRVAEKLKVKDLNWFNHLNIGNTLGMLYELIVLPSELFEGAPKQAVGKEFFDDFYSDLNIFFAINSKLGVSERSGIPKWYFLIGLRHALLKSNVYWTDNMITFKAETDIIGANFTATAEIESFGAFVMLLGEYYVKKRKSLSLLFA